MITSVNLFWVVFLIFLGVVAFLIHSGFNINVFVKKDEHIAEKFLDKFPLVTPEFLAKTHKEQTVENNQEIHELRKELEEIKELLQKGYKHG